jgi:hypothetical protein
MKRFRFILLLVIFSIFLWNCNPSDSNDNNNNDNGNNGGDNGSNTSSSPYIIDHNCTDISKIPDNWIDQVKEQLEVHYAHTSHGEQIVVGLQRLSDGTAQASTALTSQSNRYRFYHAYCYVPDGQNGLSMMDGQQSSYCETYVTPDLYWESDTGLNWTRDVLSNFDVNVSLWAWCCQLDYYSETETQNYLDRMSQLEEEFPDVTFIYMTGNAQSSEQNRYDRNNQIRQYCRDNNKFLFDFADLDCWDNGEQYTENGIPMEHPHYNGDEAGHTTYSSCDNKGKAFWWLLARIAGWSGE